LKKKKLKHHHSAPFQKHYAENIRKIGDVVLIFYIEVLKNELILFHITLANKVGSKKNIAIDNQWPVMGGGGVGGFFFLLILQVFTK